MTGEPRSNLDDDARAELLTYMVLSQLIVHASAAEWLDDIKRLDFAQAWCESNGARCEIDECLHVANMSASLAVEFARLPPLQDAQRLHELFTADWRVDYRSPIVRAMYDVCVLKVMNTGRTHGH